MSRGKAVAMRELKGPVQLEIPATEQRVARE
jgi:hypothetical protein